MLEYLVNGEQLYIPAAEREEFEKELIADGDEWEFVGGVKEGPLTEEEAAAETPAPQDFQTGPVEETAPAGPMTQEQQAAQDTGFQSEDGSLELQKQEYYNIEGIEVTKQEYNDYQTLISDRKNEEITDLLGGEVVNTNNKPVYGRVLNAEGKSDFVEEPYEDQMRNYKNMYFDAISGTGDFDFLKDKTVTERKYFADKMVPKPTLVKKQYNRITDKYELAPTADATAMIKKALPNNFASYDTPEQFDKATDVAIAKVMQEDPILQFDINVNIATNKEKIIEVVKNLQEKYDTTDPVEYEKAVKEYNGILNELVLEPVYNSQTYRNKRSQLYKVVDQVAADNKKQFGRSKDPFLSFVDRAAAKRGGESNVAMAFSEALYKGVRIMQGDFNRAQVGFAQDNLKEAVGGLKEIETGIADGSLKLEDKASWGNLNPKTNQRSNSGTVKEKLAYLKKEQKKAMDSIVFDLEEAGEVDKYVSLFNAANLKDGLSFRDMTILLGESAPQMGVAMAGSAATALTGNPMFAALGFMSMYTTEYGANYIGAIEQGLINDKIEVTDENIIKALEEGKYANQATAKAGAAISAGLEQVSGMKVAKRTLKALNLGENVVKGSASLFRGEIKKIVKQSGRQAFKNVKSGLGEALTETGQTLTSQVTLGSQLDGAGKYLNFEEIKESAIAGGALGFVLPFGGNVITQSRIELRNSARTVATRFDFGKSGNQLKAVNGFFKKAETNLKDKLELNEITEEEYKEELDALNLARTTGFKLPKNLSETSREKAFDLLIEKQKIQNDIEGIAPEMVTSQKDRIKAIDTELGNIAAVDKMNKGGKALLKSADIDSNTEYISVGSEQEIQNLLEKKGYNKSIDPKTKKEVDPADAVKTSYGAYGPAAKKGEKPFVIINEQFLFSQAKEGGKLKNNTAAHEILHKVLQDVMTPEQRIKLGTNLLQAVQSAYGDVESFNNSIFGKRMREYQSYADSGNYTQAQLAEEVFTVLGEAILDGDINIVKENAGVVQKIKTLISDAYKAITGKPIEFNTEDDLFKFIADYNKSVVKGKGLSRSMKATIKQGAKGKLSEAKGTGRVESLPIKGPSLSLDTTKSDAALIALEEAEALRDEDFDNPTLQEKVDKAEVAYDQALIEEQNAEEDAESDSVIDDEIEADTKKEKIIRPKADKTKRRYSLDKDVKKDIEPKIAKAQAMNKDLIAQEKKLNKEAAEKIEKTNDKVEQRTIREGKLAELKRNPITLPKSTELNRLEREISKELKEPIGKAANLFTKLYYDKISDNAKTAVSRQEFLESAKAEIISLTINEFKPKTTNRQGENVINDIEDIIFQRGGLRLRSLAQRLGVVGKDQGIARGSEALIKMADSSSDIDFDANDKDSVISEEKRKVSALIGQTNYDLAKDQVQEFWKENEGNTKVENFKKLPNLINNILSEMFGVTEGTLTARSGNLNRKDYANAIKTFTEKQAVFTVKEGDSKKEVRVPISEVSAFQDKLNEKKADNKDFSYKREANESIAEALLRFLPKTSADDYTYASGRKGRFSGKSTGLPKNLMELAYKIEGRKTTGIGNVERTAQKLTVEEIYDAIGAGFDADGNVVQKMGLSGKDKEGQTMLGLIKLVGRMVTNELSRTETDLDPMTKEDLAAGKNDLMFSLAENVVGSTIEAANKDVEVFKRVIDINSANEYINDVKEIAGILDSNDSKIVNKTIFSTRSKLIATNIMKNNPDISQTEALTQGQKITGHIKKELDKLKKEKVIANRKTVGTTTATVQFPKKRFGGYMYAIETGALAKQNEKHAKVMRDAYMKIYDNIANAKKDNDPEVAFKQMMLWARFTEAASMERTHFLAMGAANIGYQSDLSSSEVKAFEHAFPVADMGGKLLGAALNSKSKKEFASEYDKLIKNYVIIGLSKANAEKVGKAGYNSSMPANSEFWWQRYLNTEVANIDGGVDPHSIFVRNNKGKIVTLSEYAGWVDNKGKPLSDKMKKIRQQEAKNRPKVAKSNINLMPKNLRVEVSTPGMSLSMAENFDKAINNGNSLDQPTKGISVWDFDDTLATTKSNVLYTMPGETTIYHGGSISSIKNITGSFTYFSQDKSQASEYAKGNDGEVNGFVLNESDIASEENVFKVIRELGIQPKEKGWTVDDSRLYELIDDRFEQSFSKSDLNKLTKALAINGIKASRFTDSDLKSGKDTDNIVVFDKKSIKEENKLTAADFAKKGDEMLANGAEFDFSEFSKVVKGEKGPFFEKAMARNKKFGNENVYVLTARPANSALAIHEFLKGIGLDIPLSNITGLADSNPQAKANWVVNKFAEGYNDFYFADDHIGNVKAVKEVLKTLDVKSKVQQARISLSVDLDKRFNEIIEQESGIESYKNYETVKAGLKGRTKKFRTRFFIPPSAEDFLGLLYTTLPKGKQGDSALEFYKEHLLQPYAKAINGLRNGRIAMGKDYRAIKKEFGIVPRKLKKTFKYEDKNGDIKESLFSKEMAVRVHSWNSQGIEIPGLSKVDLPILVNYVNANPDLKAFSDKLVELKKGQEPVKLTDGWEAGTITSDLLNDLNTEGRKKLLEVWQQNVDVIFSQKNLNKLEAAYGKSYVKSLKDSLRRMKSGRNTTPSPNTVTDNFVMWLNGAIGNIMFLNRRSAVLQMLSFTNFINFEGNNLYQASKAFANQPQYWKDWVYLMNSDYLVDRRDGLKINVNEADIATTAKEGGFQGVLAKVLQAGFLPTKMADSAAIATGGASFYRNKVNTLVKDGMNLVAAEKQAMLDFIATAETSQQSSDPSKISKQQSEPIGRIILAFANTPSQYARIMKRSAQDLKNGRGKAGTHVSRIVYYGVLQNLMFNFLQQAMFAAMFGDDDATEEESEKQEASRNKKAINVANSMLDGILRGIGVGGAIFSVLKNLGIKLYRQSEKTRNKNYAKTITNELLKLSPPLSSKLSKLSRAGDAIEWGQKEIKHDKLSLKHPYVTASALTVAGVTSLPLDRAVGMAIDAVDVASAETEAWMKPLIIMGWPKWQLESEEATAANRKAKKDRLKAAEEKEELDSLSEEEKVTKVLMDLKKDEQVKILISLGISKKFIREKLSKEKDRVKHIEKMRAKKKKNSLK